MPVACNHWQKRCVITVMQRSLLAVVVLLAPATLAAQQTPQPQHHTRHHRAHVASARPLPILPQQPVTPQSRFADAPTPNPDIGPPDARPPPAISVQPELLQQHVTPTGQGYTYGSTPEAIQNADTAKAPGVGIDIPVR